MEAGVLLTCSSTTRAGRPCRYRALEGRHVCGVHARRRDEGNDEEGNDEEGNECPVCLGAMTPKRVTTTPCGHAFHTTCLRAWFRRQPLTCPMCRACCVDNLALVPGPRLLPKLKALLRTRPPPPGTFFPSYIVSQLETPGISAAMGGPEIVDMLVDVACECFTQHNFFARLRSLGV